MEQNIAHVVSGTEQSEPSCVSHIDFGTLLEGNWTVLLTLKLLRTLQSTVLENVWEEKADGKGGGGSNYAFDLSLHLLYNLPNDFIR